MTIDQSRKITGGPSREQLFDGLKYRHKGWSVPFTVSSPPKQPGSKITIESVTFDVKIHNIGIEDGSGDRWIVKLYDSRCHLGAAYLDGYYDTEKRTGWVRPA